MLVNHLSVATLLAAGLCLGGLSSPLLPVSAELESAAHAPRHSDLSDDMIALMPEGTTAIVALESIDVLDTLTEQFDEDSGEILEDMDVGLFGMIEAGLVDLTRPIGMAIGAPQIAAAPDMVLLVPMTRGTVAEDLPIYSMEGIVSYRIEGDYLGISMTPEYPEGEVNDELLDTLRVSPMGMVLDVEVWMDDFGPMAQFAISIALAEALAEIDVDPELNEQEREYTKEVARTMFDGIVDLLDSTTTLSLSIDVEDSFMDFAMEMNLMEDSPAADYASDADVTIEDCIHAMALTPGGGFAVGYDFDEQFGLMADLFGDAMDDQLEGLPEAEAEMAMRIVDGFFSLFDCSPTAISGSFYLPGAEGVGALMLHGADSVSVLDGHLAIFGAFKDSFPGLPAILESDESSLLFQLGLIDTEWISFLGEGDETLELIAQMNSIFGDSFDFAISAESDRTVITMEVDDSNRDLLDEALRGESDLNWHLERIEGRLEGAYPFGAFSMNFQPIMLSLGQLSKITEGEDWEDDSILEKISHLDNVDTTFSMYFGMRPDQWSMGFSGDIAGLVSMGTMMED